MSDIESRLAMAGSLIDWPDADLRGRVRHRLLQHAVRPPRLRWAPAALALLVAMALVVATPAGRQAVADLLRAGGITVGFGAPADPVGGAIELGENLHLEDAASMAAFPLLLPEESPLGDPDGYYYDNFPGGGAVHMVWESGPNLPAAGDLEIGVLYSQFQVVEPEVFVKSVDPAIEIREVTVRGNPGFWIEGSSHYIRYRDNSGEFVSDLGRLSANVLAWEESGVTHRIETTASLAKALALAESLRYQD